MARSSLQRRLSRAVLLLMLGALAGCERRPPPLLHTFASPEALAREVLSRLERRDRAGLQALALSRDEFEAHVWPKLAASRPERNTPLPFVWGRLQQQSDLSLAGTIARFGGKPHVLQDVRFEGEATDYGSFTVRRESILVVRTPEGEVERVKVFGSMLSTPSGQHKVFSYVVD